MKRMHDTSIGRNHISETRPNLPPGKHTPPSRKRRRVVEDVFPKVDYLSDSNDSDNEQMFSEEYKARRAVMMQLVTGRPEKMQDPVDAKLEQLIRQSRIQAVQQSTHTRDACRMNKRSSSAMSMDEDEPCAKQPRLNSPKQECDATTETTMDFEVLETE